MKYFSRIIFIDIEDKDRRSNYLKSINSLKETMLVKDYVIICEVKAENDLGNLNALMRGLKGTNDIKLTGDEEDKFNFINIVFTDKTDKDKIAELLNKVYESTKFEELGNVNLYVLITNTINNIKTKIPAFSLGEIIVQNKYEDGSTLNNEEYNKIIIELLLSLIIIPERQQFIDYIFNRNPQNNVTIFPKLFTYPNEGYLEKIKEIFLLNVLVKIKDDKKGTNLSSDFVIQNKLFQNLSIDLKDISFFRNKPKIRIPFFAGREKRLSHIETFYKNYDQKRRNILTEELNKIFIKRNDPVIIESAKRIDDTIHLKVKELLTQNFSFGFAIKSLEGLRNNLESEINITGNWYFLQELKIPVVGGTPFEKVYLIPSLIILIVCLGLLLISPYYSFALLIVFFIILGSIGLIYLKDLNNVVNNQIDNDIETIKNLIGNNPQNFIYSLKKYFIRRTLKVIANSISILEKTLKRYENAVESYRFTKEIKTMDVEAFKKIESLIQSSIEEVSISTLKKYKQEILSNYKDPDVFFYYLLDNFTKSSYFRDIRGTLFKLDKNKIESQFNELQKLAISKEIEGRIISIGNRKKILISKVHKPNGVEIIESADEYILSILDMGVIND